ncbi:MAG: kelch repeat-containing protein [Trueperaceae bacterium]
MARARALLTMLVVAFVFPAALAQPSPRGYVDMVYVPQVGKVLVFGGQAVTGPPFTALGETWWYDPADGTWEQVTTEPQPSPRSAASIEVHTPTGTVVMFGGGYFTGETFATFDETWLFDAASETWSLLEFAEGEAPESAIGEMFAYHEAADTFVMFGGFTLNGFHYLTRTWHFDLATRSWTQVSPEHSMSGRNYNAFAYDPRTELLIMSGGPENAPDAVWTYDPRTPTWQGGDRVPPGPDVPYARKVYDPDSGALVRFGGLNEPAGTVWTIDNSLNWSLLEVEGPTPDALSRHAMVAVPGVGVMTFGGVYDDGDAYHDDVWILDVNDRRWERR